MSIGPVWGEGSRPGYKRLADNFNALLDDAGRRKLRDLAAALRDRAANPNLIVEQAKTFGGGNITSAAALSYVTTYRPVAQNWYGDDGKPMWSRTTLSRPAEIHRVNCEARALLADLLAAGAAGCEIFGQCEHPEFEVWLTWPRAGYVGATVRMFVLSPDDYVYATPTYRPGDGAERPATLVENERDQKNAALVELLGKQRELYDNPATGDLQLRELDEKIRVAEDELTATLASYPDPMWSAFVGTALAVAPDTGLPILGDIDISYLSESFDDPREPRLSQRPAEVMEPAGPPCSGLRVRWDRRAPGRWPAYPTMNEAMKAAGATSDEIEATERKQ
jgi:hypothetical protein